MSVKKTLYRSQYNNLAMFTCLVADRSPSESLKEHLGYRDSALSSPFVNYIKVSMFKIVLFHALSEMYSYL